jgi:hypothetical protein
MRTVQVNATTGRKPEIVSRLSDWQYLERSFLRLVCAWGRGFADWEDKVAISRHVWEQSEAVQRLRDRSAEFPGTQLNADAPVSRRLEDLANTVLLAPSHEDAVDGLYQVLLEAIVRSYIGYVETAHPVHDAPTIALVQDLVRTKEQQRLWLRGYRRRRPHATTPQYRDAILEKIESLGNLQASIEMEEPAAEAGVRTDFRLLARAKHPAGTEPKVDWTPWMHADFTRSIEARRLFWCYGYMLEMNIAEDQLRWIYDAHDMPWAFTRDVARHLWDESRHGDSGHSRLLDFGITLSDVGFPYYDSSTPPNYEGGEENPERADPLTPVELYEQIFRIGMVAETAHFGVKKEAYADFQEGGDLESAEMVLFDIIDETSHVQYAHRWLPELAARCGRPPEEFRERGAQARAEHQQQAALRPETYALLERNPEDPAFATYQRLIETMREKAPLSNAETCPERQYLPM